jgi:predicted metal-dependent hydrolase
VNPIVLQAADARVPDHVEALRKFLLERLEHADEKTRSLDVMALTAAVEHMAAVLEKDSSELAEYAKRWRTL